MKTIGELYKHYIKKYPHLKPKQTKKKLVNYLVDQYKKKKKD